MTEEKVLDRIRKLMDRANHPNTPAGERESSLNMADRLMTKHAIDQALLDSAKPREERRRPVTVPQPDIVPGSSPWQEKFRTMLDALADGQGCMYIRRFGSPDVLIGMQENVSYVEMVWQSIMLDFLRQLDPGWSSHATYDANVYSQVLAGTKWADIASLATSNGHETPWPDGGRLKRAYRREAQRRGEEPRKHTQRNAAYRESFAEGYVRRVCVRLEEAKHAADEAASGSGAELVLHDRRDDMRDLHMQMYGYADYADYRAQMAKQREQIEAREEERRAEYERRLAAMTPRERAAYDREQERDRQRRARESDRYWRQAERENERNYDSRGMANGRAAGDKVRLERDTEMPNTRTEIES